MTQHEGPRSIDERPVVNRRSAFASVSPRHPPIPAAPSAAASHIPDKLYFRIGEVARLCDVQAYVLRFWETEFPQLRPNKGGTGQRLFRRRDVEMALRIRHLLYDEGYTIPGARQILKAEAKPREAQLALVEDAATQQLRADRLRALYRSLCGLYAMLSGSTDALRDARPLPPANALARMPASTAQSRDHRPSPAKRSPLPASDSLFEALEPDRSDDAAPPGAPESPAGILLKQSP